MWFCTEYDPILSAGSYVLRTEGRAAPLLRLPPVNIAPPVLHGFTRDGRYLAWSHAIGTVSICDLVDVQGRLAEVKQGW